ncbi:MAG TPA: sigma-70 family RNA polymerase sigma factor [Thermoanaerobaculia bacterium]
MTCTDYAPAPDTEREPLEAFLKRIRPRLKRVLKSYDIPQQDAEDLLQEALLEALRKWDTIRYLEGWLVGTLRYKCSNYWKRQRTDRVQTVELTVLEEISGPQSPAQEKEEILHDLRNLTRGLAKRHRTALWLRFGLGLSTSEVARQLGYCPSSIRKLTCRAMARLQRWAASDPDGDISSS